MMNPWDEWLEAHQPKPAEKKPKTPVITRPVSETEHAKLLALYKCTFLPGSWDKRFVHGLVNAAEITDKQAEWIDKLTYKYRRQLGGMPRKVITK